MSQRKEISLPDGKTYVTVEEIPELIAGALYPEADDHSEMTVSYLIKTKVGDDALHDHGTVLTPEDRNYLQKIWRDLPAYRDGVTETEWPAYAAAFDAAADKPEWQPTPVWNNPQLIGPMMRMNAKEEHEKSLGKAIRAGKLMTRSHAMVPFTPLEGAVPIARVPIDDFTRYVAEFGIRVRVVGPESGVSSGRRSIGAVARGIALNLKRDACAAGHDIDAEILKTQILADIQRLADEGAISPRTDTMGARAQRPSPIDPTWTLPRSDLEVVLQYVRRDVKSKKNYLQELLAYRTSGRYTLKQAADFISTEGGEDYNRILKRLEAGARHDELPMYPPGSNQRLDYGPKPRRASCVRNFYEEAYWNDLNTWLGAYEARITSRFPRPLGESTTAVPVIQDTALNPIDRRAAKAASISANYRPSPKLVRERQDLLDPPIDKAIVAAGRDDYAAVYPHLKQLALKEEPPFTGAVDEGGALAYTDSNNKPRSLTRDALAKRLKRRIKTSANRR
jgi:hypothetical protein